MKLFAVDFERKTSIYDTYTVIVIADSKEKAIEKAFAALAQNEHEAATLFKVSIVVEHDMTKPVVLYTGM